MRRTLLLILLGLAGLTQINCGSKSSPSSPGSSASYSFITNLGQDGPTAQPYQFHEMAGVAVSSDKIFVSDVDDWDVEVFDLDGTYRTTFWPYSPLGNETLPYSMTTDKFNHLYFADPAYGQIVVLNINAIPLNVSSSSVTGAQYYEGDCEPTGVAVDQNGILYVADPGCSEIYTYYQSGSLAGFGIFNSDTASVSINGGSLDHPTAIAVNPAGTKVYVSDQSENVVQIYDGGLTAIGTIGDSLGAASTATGKFDSPEGVAVDNDGNLLVVDEHNARIEKFNPGGSYLASIGNTADNISNGQISSPWQLAVDASNKVYVTDTNYQTVFEYQTN